MNDDEKQVKAHLESRGFTDVIREPVKDSTPDFLVNQKIAIEVRRLYENWFTESEVKGLEETAISLRKNILELLREFGKPVKDESWWVRFEFSRPV